MHLLCLACYQTIVECALWSLKMLSACTVRVQATSCLKHSMLACITESLDPQSAITLCCECQPVLDLQLASCARVLHLPAAQHLVAQKAAQAGSLVATAVGVQYSQSAEMR